MCEKPGLKAVLYQGFSTPNIVMELSYKAKFAKWEGCLKCMHLKYSMEGCNIGCGTRPCHWTGHLTVDFVF